MKLRAETTIRTDKETLWRMTQTPENHARWDLRFTDIEYLPRSASDKLQRFHYATRIGFGKAIRGWGETIGGPDHATSALRFGSDDPLSLIRDGAGSWTYKPITGGFHFRTVYDYSVRYGRLGSAVDRLVLRPLMVWATRWSFDRLRLWIERGQAPELSFRLWVSKIAARTALGLVWVYEGLVLKLLFAGSDQVTLVAGSGLSGPNPRLALALIGLFEIVMGAWLLSGRAERAAVATSSLVMLALSGVAAWTSPSVLIDPLGGVPKDLALIACALAVWVLVPAVPRAYKVKEEKI
ncbi:MAG: DoxX-like family protein [Chloroflexia bacterium]